MKKKMDQDKIASNAVSDLHMMYFANCDEEGNKHLGATVQLIEHKLKLKRIFHLRIIMI